MAPRKVTQRLFAVASTAAILAALPVSAQQSQSFDQRWQSTVAQQAPAKAPLNTSPTKPRHTLPVGLPQALYLIRSTLLTLNDANRSGNYTVLQDLSAPSFRAKNTAADLAQIFTNLRQRHIDLYAVALQAPKLNTEPYLDQHGLLRLTGYFPTRPLQIDFDLAFANVEGQWQLFGISVATPAAAPQVAERHAPAKK
jgi:hypothetical protein